MFDYFGSPVNPPGVTVTPRPMTASRWSPFHFSAVIREGVTVLLLGIVAAFVLYRPMTAQRFTIDESRWISTSRYFWITLVERDLFREAWRPNYIVLTQPPVARYLIGAGLALQGWTPDQLNGRYDSLRSREWNVQMGNIPDDELLRAARRVTFLFGVGAVVLLYVVGRILAGPLAGLAAAGLGLANPLLSTLWTRALAESILAFFTLGALALALRSLPRIATGDGPAAGRLLAGASLGLAAATKLSGGIGAVGLAIFGLLQQGLALAATRRPVGLKQWFDVASAATIAFVVVNPLVYPDPFGRTRTLLTHRREEMQQQQARWPGQSVPPDLGSRAETVARRTFDEFATFRMVDPIAPDVPLVVGGLAVLAAAACRELVRRRQPGEQTLFLAWVLATYAVVTANLGFDSSHYYAPPVMLNVIVAGVAVGAALRWLAARVQNVQVPFRNSGIRTAQTSASVATATQGSGPRAARSSSATVEGEPLA